MARKTRLDSSSSQFKACRSSQTHSLSAILNLPRSPTHLPFSIVNRRRTLRTGLIHNSFVFVPIFAPFGHLLCSFSSISSFVVTINFEYYFIYYVTSQTFRSQVGLVLVVSALGKSLTRSCSSCALYDLNFSGYEQHKSPVFAANFVGRAPGAHSKSESADAWSSAVRSEYLLGNLELSLSYTPFSSDTEADREDEDAAVLSARQLVRELSERAKEKGKPEPRRGSSSSVSRSQVRHKDDDEPMTSPKGTEERPFGRRGSQGSQGWYTTFNRSLSRT
jgi:hypothetical protein